MINLKQYSAPAPSSVTLSCCPLAPRSFMETRTGPHQCRTSCGLQLWHATSASFPSGGTHVLLCAWSCCSAWTNAAKPLLVSAAPPTPVNPNPHHESVWTPVQQQAPNHKKFLFRNTKKPGWPQSFYLNICLICSMRPQSPLSVVKLSQSGGFNGRRGLDRSFTMKMA